MVFFGPGPVPWPNFQISGTLLFSLAQPLARPIFAVIETLFLPFLSHFGQLEQIPSLQPLPV